MLRCCFPSYFASVDETNHLYRQTFESEEDRAPSEGLSRWSCYTQQMCLGSKLVKTIGGVCFDTGLGLTIWQGVTAGATPAMFGFVGLMGAGMLISVASLAASLNTRECAGAGEHITKSMVLMLLPLTAPCIDMVHTNFYGSWS